METKVDDKQEKKIIKVREYKAPFAGHVSHISLGESDRLWLSYGDGKLVETDLQGKRLPKKVSLPKIKTSGGLGFHTVTKNGDLVYTNKDYKTIMKVTHDNRVTLFIDTGDFQPLSIHSSRINGDILVGMMTDKKAIVRRYNKTGKEIQSLGKKQQLYNNPHYITENINGDICTSDYNKRAVVVVDKIGRYRFSFTGHDQKSVFRPFGICTDILGRIIVCSTKVVEILDRDGQWLCALKEKEISPRSALKEKENSPRSALEEKENSPCSALEENENSPCSALEEKENSPCSALEENENSPCSALEEKENSPRSALEENENSPCSALEEKENSPHSALEEKENSPCSALEEKENSPRSALEEKENSPCSALEEKENSLRSAREEKVNSPCIALEEKEFSPRSVCVDDENNLHVGQCETKNVKVYKYLQ